MYDDIIVVIATYNEAETIETILRDWYPYRVIVVDDSSPDGTGELARQHGNAIVISRSRKMGIRSAYCLGLERAIRSLPRPQFIFQMDAGGTHHPLDGRVMVRYAIDHNLDLVIGSRFKGYFKIRGWRTLVSLLAAWLMRLLGIEVYDATSGFRCWRFNTLVHLWQDWDTVRAKGFAFQLELLFRAHKCGFDIGEYIIPYVLTNSSFRWWMIWEGFVTICRLFYQKIRGI